MKNSKSPVENPDDVFASDNTSVAMIDNNNMVATLGMVDMFEQFENGELDSESLNSVYLNLDAELGVEKVFVHIENSTMADTINGTDDRVACVVLLNKQGDRFICADKQLVSKLQGSSMPSLVKITYKGMASSKSNKAWKYRDFDVRRAILKG